jgi:hypothetical protein
MRVKFIPRVGIETDGGRLLLGCTRSEAEAVLGKAEDDADICYYFDGELALDFGDDGTLCYIECRSGMDAEICGVNAFRTKADKLFDILAAENGPDIDDPEDGHSFIFNGIRVSVWRETTPEEVLESFEEAEEDGEPMPDDVKAEEMNAAEHWDTVGVFAPGYYE